MITKKNNVYKIRLEEVLLKDNTPAQKSIEFEFENHDDIFNIIDKMQEMDIFGDKGQAVEFALGVKLFSEVLLNHRENPLFDELKPAFATFMKKLKGKN
jgi:hypothetical protein